MALAALAALEAEASVAASREASKVDEAEADSVEASVVAVEVASEAAATLALAAAIETATEHPMEPRPALDLIEETEAATEASPVVGMSLGVVDAHMKTGPAATETAAVDMAIVTVTVETAATVAIVIATATVTETARDVGLAATWNPLAAEKVGIVIGTMIALATMTAGSEDTTAVATKIPGNCAGTKLDETLCASWRVSTLGG